MTPHALARMAGADLRHGSVTIGCGSCLFSGTVTRLIRKRCLCALISLSIHPQNKKPDAMAGLLSCITYMRKYDRMGKYYEVAK